MGFSEAQVLGEDWTIVQVQREQKDITKEKHSIHYENNYATCYSNR